MNSKGTSICIASAKGGVGKTITTLNLAGLYESLEKKVLIIDFDLSHGGIATALNIDVKKSIYNLVDDYNNNRYKDFNNYVVSYDKYIDILASPKDPRQANKVDNKYLNSILNSLTFAYDVILIDTNHIINELNLVLIQRVDNILFVTTNDPYDLKNLKSILSIFKDTGITNYKILLNQSVIPFKNYFSLYDIKNIIKNNIDYTLSSSFFIPDIDNYVLNGQIIILNNKCQKVFPEDYTSFVRMATDFLEDKKEEENNHEE